LDVQILWRTVRKVLVRDGISAAGEATMSKFEGSSPQENVVALDESIKYNRSI